MLLEVNNVTCHYGGVQALDDVSIQEKDGEIVALIGANGAGKTTLLNLICGFIKPTKGTIFFQGRNITHLAPERIVNMGIGQVPEGRLLFGPLTVRENLELGAFKWRGKKYHQERINDFEFIMDLFPILADRLEQQAGTLSGGEQQMLAIGRGFLGKPRLLLLDEPSLGLAPLMVKEIFKVIQKIKEQGTTILLVEQNAKAALRLADRAFVIETGQIRLQGRSEDLLSNEEVKRAYLGRDASC